MNRFGFGFLRNGVVAGTLACFAVSASGQYSLHDLADFEDKKFPDNCITIGDNPERDVKVVPLGEVQGVPGDFRAVTPTSETGKYGLRLHSKPGASTETTVMSGILLGKVLDRDQLGTTGRALFQADMFVSPAEEELPAIAVLAMEPPVDASGNLIRKHMNKLKGAFYRFGFMRIRKEMFFSAIIPNQPIYPSFDKKLLNDLPRGNWHRFAIVLEGPDVVHCYIDGREAAFSPVKDARLRRMVVGVVIIEKGTAEYDVYVDNLSIQVSTEGTLLPESPYNAGWKIPASTAVASTAVPAPESQPALSAATPLATDTRWRDPSVAWADARRLGKPLLLYFHAPGVPSVAKVNEWLLHDSAAGKFLDDHVCARIDVNQLSGGLIASKYEVFRVPAFLVISPDASSHARALYREGDTWETLQDSLKLN